MITGKMAALAGLLALALAGSARPALSQGTTVDAYQYASGQRSQSSDVAADPTTGRLYAAGYGTDASGTGRWIVRRSADGGATWATVDDYAYPGALGNSAGSVAVSASGEVFAFGSCRLSAGGTGIRWVVRKSADGGGTWSTVDDHGFPGGSNVNPWKIAADGAGGVYAVGNVFLADSSKSSSSRWVVRRSADGGATWQTTDLFQSAAGKGAFARAVCVDGATGAVFVAGTDDSTTPSRWLIRKSVDGGATFSTLAGSAYPSGGTPYAVKVDAAGAIYVAGNNAVTTSSKRITTTTTHGIVRRSGNGGASFATVDDFQYAANANFAFRDLLVDSLGRVTACGSGDDAPATVFPRYAHWVVRQSSDGTAPFVTVDDYLPSGAKNASTSGLAEAAGSLFACGRLDMPDTANTNWFWVVRRY